jgi:hypothetical protein
MSKRSDAVAIMSANADKTMSEVVTLIADAINVTEGNAKSYYRYIVEHKLAPGFVVKSTRGVTAAKLVKQVKLEQRTHKVKTKAAAVAALTAKPKSKQVSAESLLPVAEIAKIKEANLKRMREVTSKRKVYTNVARPEGPGVPDFDADEAREYVDSVLDTVDNFKAPRFLSKDELKAVL